MRQAKAEVLEKDYKKLKRIRDESEEDEKDTKEKAEEDKAETDEPTRKKKF